jgi:HD-like signal output (HDOD) protein
MEVSCSSCQKSYQLPDDRLPSGKIVSFPCPSCKSKIKLDLRSGSNGLTDSTNPVKMVFKPISESDDLDLEKEDLKAKIVKRVDDLPPMPKVLFKAREVMADPGSSFKEIAKVIETDQAIAARVLKMANSAYYGLSGMVSSIHQASVVLGYKTLEELIIMVSSSSLLGQQLRGYNLSAGVLWKHSLAVALASRIIAQKRMPTLENDAFSAGLIHDAGKLALDPYVLSKRKEIDRFLGDGAQSFLAAERSILTVDHTEIAHELCKKWKLPDNQADAMRYHHEPDSVPDNILAQIVHVADSIAVHAGFLSSPTGEMPINKSSLAALRLKEEDIEKIATEVCTSVNKIETSLG